MDFFDSFLLPTNNFTAGKNTKTTIGHHTEKNPNLSLIIQCDWAKRVTNWTRGSSLRSGNAPSYLLLMAFKGLRNYVQWRTHPFNLCWLWVLVSSPMFWILHQGRKAISSKRAGTLLTVVQNERKKQQSLHASFLQPQFPSQYTVSAILNDFLQVPEV